MPRSWREPACRGGRLFSWLQSAGYTTETGVNQIDFGFELCSTSGQSETFTVTGYTLDATCASGTSC